MTTRMTAQEYLRQQQAERGSTPTLFRSRTDVTITFMGVLEDIQETNGSCCVSVKADDTPDAFSVMAFLQLPLAADVERLLRKIRIGDPISVEGAPQDNLSRIARIYPTHAINNVQVQTPAARLALVSHQAAHIDTSDGATRAADRVLFAIFGMRPDLQADVEHDTRVGGILITLRPAASDTDGRTSAVVHCTPSGAIQVNMVRDGVPAIFQPEFYLDGKGYCCADAAGFVCSKLFRDVLNFMPRARDAKG